MGDDFFLFLSAIKNEKKIVKNNLKIDDDFLVNI
jgi:hypothetical protein